MSQLRKKTLVLIASLAILLVAFSVFAMGCDGLTTSDKLTSETDGETEAQEGNGSHVHVFDRQVVETEYLKSEATCIQLAVYYYSCECGEAGTQTFEYGVLGEHNFENGVCTVCGEEDTGNQLAYTLSEDQTYYIVTGKGSYSNKNLVIPSTYKGLPVKAIADRAFQSWKTIETVEIPDSIESIGENVFIDCTNLKYNSDEQGVGSYLGNEGNPYILLVTMSSANVTEYVLPSTTKFINYAAFYRCSSLTRVIIPDSVVTIGESAFSSCNLLSYVSIGKGVKEIGAKAFNLYSLKTVEIATDSALETIGVSAFENTAILSFNMPSGVVSIGSKAFWNCKGLLTITLPATLKTIGTEAFYNCEKLLEVYNLSSRDVTVGDTGNGQVAQYAKYVYTSASAESKFSTDSDGFVFFTNGENKYLMAYTGTQKEITLPTEGTYGIYRCAFYNSDITGVIISDNVTYIAENVFSSCYSLKSVTIGTGVTIIGKAAFAGCTALTSATFRDKTGWWYASSATATQGTEILSIDLNADMLTSSTYGYLNYYMFKGQR